MINNQNQQTEGATIDAQDSRFQMPDALWLLGVILITSVATLLRFWQLALKPLHHDEGVNSYFLVNLFRDGVYRYDPSNYHGPTLYYIALAFTKIFGLETVSIRASMAVFGVLMVFAAFFLRKYIGSIGSLAAALFIALSPGMVYISRYFIHEIFFVFCSFGIVLGILFFIEGRKAGIFAIAAMTVLLLVGLVAPVLSLASAIGADNANFVWILRGVFLVIEAFLIFLIVRMLLNWNEGRPIYLILAAASMALFFATKETAFITIGTMAIACVCVYFWRRVYVKKDKTDELETSYLNWSTFLERCRESNPPILAAACAGTFIYISVLFFSSFFTHPHGVIDAFKAYIFWTKTGTGDHTQNGYLGYVKWLWKIEAPIVFVSAVGTLIALFKGTNRFAMFAGLWAYGLFLAYTIIPYKTPWLALSFLLPMCIVAGYGINELVASRDIAYKAFAGLVAIVAFGILGYQTYDLNFVRYDNDTMPYVYAHTTRGFLNLVDKINYYAEKSGKGTEATIEIVSPDYWPMPWYTRDYKRANYHGNIVPVSTSEMIIAKKGVQEDQLKTDYAARYKYAGEYPLRPGVDLILLVRRDLADKDTKDLYSPELNDFDPAELQTEPLSTK